MRNKTRRIWTVLLVAIMLVSSVFENEKVEAKSKKVSLSSKRITLEVGKSQKLRVKNNKKKVKWSVDKKKIIKLSKQSKKGVTVKGLKKGNAKVIATIGKKKYLCKVTVREKKKRTIAEEESKNSVLPTPSQETPKPVPSVGPSEYPGPSQRPAEPTIKPDSPTGEEVEKDTFTVTGVVKDASGMIIPGIEVYFGEVYEDFIIEEQAVTSEDGTYSVELKKGRHYNVRVGKALLLEPQNRNFVSDGQNSFNIELGKELVKVSGKLVDNEDNGLHDLNVLLYEKMTDDSEECDCIGKIRTTLEGKYDEWLEKDKVYSVFVKDTGKTYTLKDLDTSDKSSYNLIIEDTLYLVEGILKNTDGTVVECDEIYAEWKDIGYKTISLSEEGRYSFWISKDIVYDIKAYLPNCPIKCTIGSVTGGDPATYELVVELEMCDIQGKLFYENGTNVEEFTVGGYTSWLGPDFLINGENGNFRFSLPKEKRYDIIVWMGSESYDVGELVSGNEDTYKFKLPVSLCLVQGSLQEAGGEKLISQEIDLYSDAEHENCVKSIKTDTEGNYKEFLTLDQVYYPVYKSGTVNYNAGVLNVSDKSTYSIKLNVALMDFTEEIEKIEVKTNYFTSKMVWDDNQRVNNPITYEESWYLYREDNGKQGNEYYGKRTHTSSPKLYLPVGEKIYLKIVNSDFYSNEKYCFQAGTFTVGDASTYSMEVELCKMRAKVMDSTGKVLKSSSVYNYYVTNNGQIRLTWENSKEGICSTSYPDKEGVYTIYGVKGEEYDISVTMYGKTYPFEKWRADSEENRDLVLNVQFDEVTGTLQ